MTETEKIICVKNMTDDSVSESVICTYLMIAGNKIIRKAYPFSNTVTEVPAEYGYLQCEIATYLLNKRGAEGQTAHNENGISRTYGSADVPSSMLRYVVPRCEVVK